MGEIADSMVDGSCCSLCSTYFEHSHGYPVLCKECWRDNPGSRSLYQKAKVREIGCS